MCTVSIIRGGETIRIACNRDEQRTRLPAIPPAVHEVNGVRAIMPLDANAGGTWIGANEFGVAMMLLNMSIPGDAQSAFSASRGLIIPSLLPSLTIGAAVELLNMQALIPCKPFRLILADADQTIECRFDGRALSTHSHGQLKAQMYTSSALGDDLVDSPRRRLFEQMLMRGSPAEQDAFHRHSWAGHAHLSVCMRRADAMTVSCTTIELSPESASLRYHAGPPDAAADITDVSLSTRGLSAA